MERMYVSPTIHASCALRSNRHSPQDVALNSFQGPGTEEETKWMLKQVQHDEITFHAGDLDSSDVQLLLAFHFAQMRETSPPEACHVLPIDGLKHPAVTFWSAREGGELVGVGALKELTPDHGEVKSMRTAPSALGRGVGRALLHHILAEAKLRGYQRLSLETGSTEPFAAALRLYESEGFLSCGPFGDYQDTPFTRFFTREL
jgi:putative acetyltransferase